jgi:hypothetical protein
MNKKAKRRRNAIISAKRAMASVRANPRIVYRNIVARTDGLRAIPEIRAAKMDPIPTPAPAIAIVARPAAISLAAIISIIR